ncbi:MAG: hypothetical protein QOF48_1483, partial [Verrucomicrobiota bacterium]
MTKVILILLAGLLFEAVGVVYLSAGMKELSSEIGQARPITAAKLWRFMRSGFTNQKILLGVFYE